MNIFLGIIYIISFVICFLVFLDEFGTVTNVTFFEYCKIMITFICLFIPILNTIWSIKIIKKFIKEE